MENFEEIVKHKDNQILNLKNNIEALKEQLKEKEEEIERQKKKKRSFCFLWFLMTNSWIK